MSVRKAFGRGFDSRRLHHIVVLLLLLIPVLVFAFPEQITVFQGSRKLQIPLQSIDGTSYVRLTDLENYLSFEVHSISGNQNISVTSGKHNVILSANRTLVSLDEQLVSLNKPVLLSQNVWYVPLDFIPKVLKIIVSKRFLWLENNRSLLLDDAQPNQLILKYLKEANQSRLVFQSSRPVEFSVVPEGNVVVIRPKTEDVAPTFRDMTFDDNLIKKLSIQSSETKKEFRIETADAVAFRSYELNDPPRFVIDFQKKEETAEIAPQPTPPTPAPEKEAPPTLLPSPTAGKKVIVIDPGHGGTETGAAGPNGTFEKDIVMGIARRLKAILESSTGMRVILTRDGDQVISLDDRTAKANNNKADLFVSIHANATIRGRAKGAETYFLSAQATDNEARNIAAVENNAIGLNQQSQPVDDNVKLILWDMAQTEYLAESSQLAETIQQELNTTLGISNRGIKQAPFRVLTGATMPAVLVEVGFINNPEEEKLMMDGEYQMKIAGALFRSILKFQSGVSAEASQLH